MSYARSVDNNCDVYSTVSMFRQTPFVRRSRRPHNRSEISRARSSSSRGHWSAVCLPWSSTHGASARRRVYHALCVAMREILRSLALQAVRRDASVQYAAELSVRASSALQAVARVRTMEHLTSTGDYRGTGNTPSRYSWQERQFQFRYGGQCTVPSRCPESQPNLHIYQVLQFM